jgi:hypothetical protein
MVCGRPKGRRHGADGNRSSEGHGSTSEGMQEITTAAGMG